jgi:hypothetical protein
MAAKISIQLRARAGTGVPETLTFSYMTGGEQDAPVELRIGDTLYRLDRDDFANFCPSHRWQRVGGTSLRLANARDQRAGGLAMRSSAHCCVFGRASLALPCFVYMRVVATTTCAAECARCSARAGHFGRRVQVS